MNYNEQRERKREIQQPRETIIEWGPGALLGGLADRNEWNPAEAALGINDVGGTPHGSTIAEIEIAVLAYDGNRGNVSVTIELTKRDVENLIRRLNDVIDYRLHSER